MLDEGELKSTPNAQEEIRRAMVAAKNFLKENKVLEKIEIKSQDLSKIKRLATEREMDYKRLVSEILHDYATGLLKKARWTTSA